VRCGMVGTSAEAVGHVLETFVMSSDGLRLGRAGPLPQVLTSRGRQKDCHRPATRQYIPL
jgi:hypothetical protein